MNYEHRYNEALARAKEQLVGAKAFDYDNEQIAHNIRTTVYNIFPELEESENEKIRKELINFVKSRLVGFPQCEKYISWLEKQGDANKEYWRGYREGKKEILDKYAELEKQGEQQPVDKVEPKFKVENWYQCTKDFFGKGVTFDKNTAYYCAKEGCLQDEYGCHIAIVKDLYDNFKLWTIEDAKNGDVLVWDDSKCIALFKNIYDEESFNSHGFVGHCTDTFQTRLAYHDIEGAHPATKEQRDLLFQKMKEAGYEWNEDKKELIKL